MILKYWKEILSAVIGIAITAMPVYYFGYWNGYDAGSDAFKAKIATNTLERIENNEKKKIEIRRLDDSDLVRRYCHWVYDLPYDECVRTVVPVK